MSIATALPITGPAAKAPAARPAARPAGASTAGRLLSALVSVLVSLVAVLAIVIAVVTRMSPGGQYFGHPVLTMLSGSMTGTINTGDLIVDDPVTAAQARNLQVGQIISVHEAPGSQALVTHRIVAVQVHGGEVSYLTKGDANNHVDAVPRPSSDVVGVFRAAIPRGGYVLYALHRPQCLGLILASAVLWFLIGPLFRLARDCSAEQSS
jgi:signal peptidase